ncbi:hypothetical protein BC826DRAFT_1111114 [Russula brevipes]|nr:hypothetical protein BC826DRAFT_1111114 [Russula brevipes]
MAENFFQDFLYCARLMLYDTERSLKAPDQMEYKDLTQRISVDADYSYEMLDTCTGKLGLKDTAVLHMPPDKAITDYIKFCTDAAEKDDWVASLVAAVPCIQSYYYLAVAIKNAKPDEGTLWYDNWVKPNLNDTSVIWYFTGELF